MSETEFLFCSIFLFEISDATYIRLGEFANQIDEWERKHQTYNSEHKTDVYHDFRDFKTKLQLQLDSVESASIPKVKADRSTLYNRIEELSKAFDQRIHSEHYTCPFCVQVKEVPINL